MPVYPLTSFSSLLENFNTQRTQITPWFDKIEMYRLEYWERSKKARFAPAFENDHAHRFWELHLVLGGEQTYDIDKESLVLHAGKLLLIPPLFPHKQQVSDEGVTKFVLMFHIPKDLPEPFGSILEKAEQNPLRVPFENTLLLPLDYLFCRGDLQSEDSIHILSSCLFLFFEALFQQLSPLLPSVPPRIAQKHNYAMLPEDIVDYIENRISRRVTADETAQHLFMSTRHLNRRLLTSCGMTFGELSARVRCDFAKQLLLHTDLSVEKIGEQVGFCDAGSFARFFKRMTDVPPSVFRKKQEGKRHE